MKNYSWLALIEAASTLTAISLGATVIPYLFKQGFWVSIGIATIFPILLAFRAFLEARTTKRPITQVMVFMLCGTQYNQSIKPFAWLIPLAIFALGMKVWLQSGHAYTLSLCFLGTALALRIVRVNRINRSRSIPPDP